MFTSLEQGPIDCCKGFFVVDPKIQDHTHTQRIANTESQGLASNHTTNHSLHDAYDLGDPIQLWIAGLSWWVERLAWKRNDVLVQS